MVKQILLQNVSNTNPQQTIFNPFINLVDKYFISCTYMDKLYKAKLFACFRNKHFAKGNEACCTMMFIC